MKRILLLAFLCVGIGVSAFAQTPNPRVNDVQFRDQPVTPFCPQDMTCLFTNSSGVLYSVRNGVATAVGGGGGGSPGGADTNVQFNDSSAFGGNSGFVYDKTSKISLGVAGSSVGAVGFRNATSGTITLQAVTGALGTVTLSLPAATDTLVGRATTDTFTNKTYDTAES